MKIDDSDMVDKWIGLFEKDEDGNYEEIYTFEDVESVERYITKLQKALDKFNKR